MNSYIRGQKIRLYTEPPFKTLAGVLTDPTTVKFRVTAPDGVTADYTLAAAEVIKDTSRGNANGDFYYDLVTAALGDTKLGTWIYAPIGDGPVTAAQKNYFVLLNEKIVS